MANLADGAARPGEAVTWVVEGISDPEDTAENQNCRIKTGQIDAFLKLKKLVIQACVSTASHKDQEND